MGRLSQFRRVPGFGIEELVSVANGLLADKPDLQVSRRTVRFYVSQGWVPAPVGSPKFARYPYESLALVVGLRRLQDQGWSLPLAAAEVSSKLAEGHEDELLGPVEKVNVAIPLSSPAPRRAVREARVVYKEAMVRYRFGSATVEISEEEDPGEALARLRDDLDSYLTSRDSSDV